VSNNFPVTEKKTTLLFTEQVWNLWKNYGRKFASSVQNRIQLYWQMTVTSIKWGICSLLKWRIP
jgi:hypothetical protein